MDHIGFIRRRVFAGMENTGLEQYARSLLVEASQRTKQELLLDLNEAFEEIIRLRQQIAEIAQKNVNLAMKLDSVEYALSTTPGIITRSRCLDANLK